jgi:Domain of unknown function (DUF4352)
MQAISDTLLHIVRLIDVHPFILRRSNNMYQPPQNPDEPIHTPPQQPSYPQQTPPQGYPPQQLYYPPSYVPPPQKKSRTWLWIVLGVIAVVLFACIGFSTLVLRGAGNAVGTISTTVASTATTEATQGSTPAPTTAPAGVAKVGDTITVNDVATTLISVKKLAADQYTQPKPGNIFIVVHVKITNNSTGEVDYNVFDFHVRSGSGNITDEEVVPPSTYTANNMLNSGKLSAGGNVEGDIIFQVKKGDHKAQMTWQPNFLGNAGDNAWNLGL